MKKVFFSVVAVMALNFVANASETIINLPKTNFEKKIKDIYGLCRGTIIVYNSKGEKINSIPFSSDAKTNIDCADAYKLAVITLEKTFKEGETTGGTFSF